jgi:hypothetical protein
MYIVREIKHTMYEKEKVFHKTLLLRCLPQSFLLLSLFRHSCCFQYHLLFIALNNKKNSQH